MSLILILSSFRRLERPPKWNKFTSHFDKGRHQAIYVLNMASLTKLFDMRILEAKMVGRYAFFHCIYSFGVIDRSILERDVIICELRKGIVKSQHCHHHGVRFTRDLWLVIITTLLIYIMFEFVMGPDTTKD